MINKNIEKVGLIIKEAYFEESSDMKNLLYFLDEIRKPILNKTLKYDDEYYDKISSSKSVISFNRTIEDFFGFKTFALKIIKIKQLNAWTIPISSKFDIDHMDGAKYIKKTKYGYKFINNSYNVIINISSSLISEKSFNSRDIMAILLHEIGHNFSFAINNMSGLFGTMMKASNVCDIFLDYIYIWMYDKEFRNNIPSMYYNTKDNKMNKLVDHLNKQDNLIINITSFFMKPFAFLGYIGVNVISSYSLLLKIIYKLTFSRINPIDIMIELYGYDDEKVADNFATIYGFGAELSKFQLKIYDIHVNEFKNSDFISKLLYIIVYPMYISESVHDPHPKNISRIIDQLNILELELQKEDIDPKMKNQIKQDIKNIKIQLNKLNKKINEHGSLISKYYNDLMIKLFGGDFRQLLFKNKNYIKIYDNID